ncbi:hypothetical protein [Bremerella cremea]|uniref:hypothetical protein n=1 Tax=Bremerella cremea TaxID=1031537 RepID=UPI0031EC1B85
MTRIFLCVALLALVGCEGEPLVDLPPSGQSAPAQGSASGDSTPTNEPASGGAPPALTPETMIPPGVSPTAQPPAESKPKKGVIHQTTDEIVNAKEWLMKEGIEVKDGKIEGTDPLSQAASGYFTLAAQASTLGLKHQLQQYKAVNGKSPTYAEFKQMLQDNRIQLAKLRWYEIYAYNEDTGTILVLVDTVAQEEGP